MGGGLLRAAVLGGVLLAGAVACGGGGGAGGGAVAPPELPIENPGTPDAGPGSQTTPDAGPPDAGPPPVTHLCDPTAGEARWVLEGEALSATVTCATGATGMRFAVDDLPPGASWDEASATLRWRPANDQAAVWNLTLREVGTRETGTLKIGVAENGGAKIVDPAKYTEEFGLPVVHIAHEGDLTAGGFKPAQVVYRGHRYAAEAKFRGATSNTFPNLKRSITMKFPDEDLFDEPVFGGPFLDRKRVVLISTFNDNSYFRSRLAFDLWNRMSPAHARIQTYSAVVYRNGNYAGVFTVADQVHKRLLEASGLDKDADLFKHELENANFSRLRQDGTPKDNLHEQVEKSEGLPTTGFSNYDTLVAWVADADAASFRTGFRTKLNAPDYEDWWIFNTLVLGTDSMAKNSYHAYDPKTGGPWRFIPWDLDATLGQNYDTTRSSPTARLTFEGNNLLFRKMLQEPTIAGPMRERYRQLLRAELSESVVQGLIDGYVKETAPSARRDWAKWQGWYRNFGGPNVPGDSNNYEQGAGNFPKWHLRTDFNDYEGEVQYVRDWVRTRWGSLQNGGVP